MVFRQPLHSPGGERRKVTGEGAAAAWMNPGGVVEQRQVESPTPQDIERAILNRRHPNQRLPYPSAPAIHRTRIVGKFFPPLFALFDLALLVNRATRRIWCDTWCMILTPKLYTHSSHSLGTKTGLRDNRSRVVYTTASSTCCVPHGAKQKSLGTASSYSACLGRSCCRVEV